MSSATSRPLARLLPALAVVALLALALVIRLRFFPHESPDYVHYLSRWWGHLDREGFAGLGVVFADYAPPYLYLLYLGTLAPVGPLLGIKLISLAGDVLLAGSVFLLASRFVGRRWAALAAAGMLLAPGVVLNSAAWGQCDAIYTSFLVLSVLALTRERDAWAWVFFGMALAVKLQAVFLLPALGVVWLVRVRRSWWTPVLAPLVIAASWAPCLLAGRPLSSLLDVYRSQASSGLPLSYAPNVWYLVPRPPTPVAMTQWEHRALLVALVVVGGVCLLSLVVRRPWTPQRVVVLAAFSTLAVPTFLPHMRERYMYPGEILVLVAALALGRSRWWMPVLLFACSGLVYLDQLYPARLHRVIPGDVFLLGIEPVLAVVAVLAWDLVGRRRQDRPRERRQDRRQDMSALDTMSRAGA
ncbi:hypothetical protein ADJ73_05350 [Arsenicicoccus sp. oral taxon 190]|nr:hypothetical protein ADJ73_05350 [Arsenicicoccus sp. oral taxon 190]